MVAPPAVYVREVKASDCLDFSGKTVYGDFRDDLVKNGFAIVKGAIPKERAAQYVDDMQTYLEEFNLGYKRDDPSTINEDCLPVINEKGMLMHYGIAHEDFVWKIRTEPGLVKGFATVYGTDDLIASFDSINITFPRRTDIKDNKAWPHQDQDPKRPGFRCLQGIVNLAPNGSDDGGLVIMKGAHLLSEEYHKAFASEEPLWAWTNEWYGYKDTGVAWLKSKGCEFTKVCCEPGDLLLWDSRLPHYNVSPTGNQTRFAAYVCYGPASSATQEELIAKKQAYHSYIGSSHWPQMLQPNLLPCLRKDGTPCPYQRTEPKKPRVLDEHRFRYTGIPYITASA